MQTFFILHVVITAKNMANIQLFNSKEFGEVRGTTDDLGNPVLCLSDLCKALGIKNPSQVLTRLDRDGVITNEGVSLSTNQYGKTTEQKVSLTYINEPNFYRIIFQSRKKEAIDFQHWVFNDVLPSIRANGGYLIEQKSMSVEDFNRAVADRANCVVASAYKERDFWHSVACDLKTINDSLNKRVRQLELGRRY